MISNQVEMLAVLCLVFFYFLHKGKNVKLAAIPVCFITVQAILAMETAEYVNFALALLVTCWASMAIAAWQDYQRRASA